MIRPLTLAVLLLLLLAARRSPPIRPVVLAGTS